MREDEKEGGFNPVKRLVALLVGLLCLGAQAQEDKLPKFDAVGPKKIVLGDNLATLDLPKGYVFYGKDQTMKLMEQLGNRADGTELGLVLSQKKDEQDYLVLIEYEDTGHVKDDEQIDKDKLLDAMKEGTEAQNEERKEKGISAVHVTGWMEEPRYEKAVHHVIWAPKGTVEGEGDIVNYNTRILGRTGVLSVNLMCGAESLAKRKPAAEAVLKATSFNEGKKYEDFKEGDKLAEYGIMGLILGGSAILAKKTGLIALAYILLKKGLLLLLALKKFAIFIVLGVVAVARKGFSMLTGRRSEVAERGEPADFAPGEVNPENPPSDTHSS